MLPENMSIRKKLAQDEIVHKGQGTIIKDNMSYEHITDKCHSHPFLCSRAQIYHLRSIHRPLLQFNVWSYLCPFTFSTNQQSVSQTKNGIRNCGNTDQGK